MNIHHTSGSKKLYRHVECSVRLNSNQESNLESYITIDMVVQPTYISVFTLFDKTWSFVALSTKRHTNPTLRLSLYYSGLMSWVKAKDDELLRAEAVAGVPDRVAAQITEVEVHKHILSPYPFSIH